MTKCGCALMAFVAFVQVARADTPTDVNVKVAMGEMKMAQQALKLVDKKFGGHKVKALEALDDAIAGTSNAMNVLGFRDYRESKPLKKGPPLPQALDIMRSARENLSNTQGTLGGHKRRAIDNLDKAINEVESALKFEANRKR